MQNLVKITTPNSIPPNPPNQESLAGLCSVPLINGTVFHFDALDATGTIVLASAFDKRDADSLLLTSESGWRHELDYSFSSHAQRFHITIPAGISSVSVKQLDTSQPLWVLADREALADAYPSLWPEMPGANRLARFFQRLEHGSMAQFGWMGGCVLEAFDALAQRDVNSRWTNARERWLGRFLDDTNLRFQGPRGQVLTGTLSTIEAGLPFASIARRDSSHPSVDMAVQFLTNVRDDNFSCEGCYTAAYPLTQIAMLREDQALLSGATRILYDRHEKLVKDGTIYLRNRQGQLSYPNWTRGIAWYLLGISKCIRLAGPKHFTPEFLDHVRDRAEWVIAHQGDHGLWPNFFDQPALPPDTSGSAGIATALMEFRKLGLVDAQNAADSAWLCWDGLVNHLSIDGWLCGIAKNNKQGEFVQRLPARSCEPFGAGLMGQLAANLPIEQPVCTALCERYSTPD